MSELDVIERKIRKKEAEIQSLEEKLRSARVYIQALLDVRRELDGGDESADLRPGSMIALAKDAIARAGTPLHVDDILTAIGKTADSKSSLTGSLAAYVRRGEIFTRPAPNTYGLIGSPRRDEGPPPGFGSRRATFDKDVDDIPF